MHRLPQEHLRLQLPSLFGKPEGEKEEIPSMQSCCYPKDKTAASRTLVSSVTGPQLFDLFSDIRERHFCISILLPIHLSLQSGVFDKESKKCPSAQSEAVQNLLPHRKRAQGGYCKLDGRTLKGSPCINSVNSFERSFQTLRLCRLIALSKT